MRQDSNNGNLTVYQSHSTITSILIQERLITKLKCTNGISHYQCAVLPEVKILMKKNNKYLSQVANSGFVESSCVVLSRVPHGWKRYGNQVDNWNSCKVKVWQSECGKQPLPHAGSNQWSHRGSLPDASTSESPILLIIALSVDNDSQVACVGCRAAKQNNYEFHFIVILT